jgi:hypothetical protein
MWAELEKSDRMEPQNRVSTPDKLYKIETRRTMQPAAAVPTAAGNKAHLPHDTQKAVAQHPVPPQQTQQSSGRTLATPVEVMWRGRPGFTRLSRKCLLLVVAYGFGALLAGVLQARGSGHMQTILGLYLQNYADLLASRSAQGAVTLFGTQYFSLLAAATWLLILGLCAFGPLLIFLFVIFYGVGTGTISLQLLLQADWQQAALVLLFWGLPVSLAASCLCAFGSSALGVGLRLQNAAFGGKSDTRIASSTRRLVGQYLFWAVLLLPLCGVATALLYLLGGLG